MTQWGIDTLFNPGKRHMDEEKRRLQSTREEVGDSSGGRRIDLESGKVRLTGPSGEDENDSGSEDNEAAGNAAGENQAGENEAGENEAGENEAGENAAGENQAGENPADQPHHDAVAEDEDTPAARARRRRRNVAG
jgi:Family of unknown function (DUF6191)